MALAGCLLLAAGCKPRPDVANRRLLAACETHNLDDVRRALADGADPNTIDPNPARGFSALEVGIESPEIVAALLKAGASPTKRDANGISAACMGAALGSTRSLQLMIDAGAKVETADAKGKTLLDFAAGACQLDNAALLLKAGANINVPDHLGLTPLFYAAIAWEKAPKKITMVRFLLSHGADANAKDLKGRTAADWANPKTLGRATGTTQELVDILRKAQKQFPRR